MDANEQIIGPTVDDCYLTISADRTTITEGDNVQFTVFQVGDCSSSPVVNIYVNDSIVYRGRLPNNSLFYVHTFNEPGEFTVYANTDELIYPSKSIDITVEEDIIEPLTSEVSWEINNKNVQSIEINNKEVKSIITSNGQVLYNKEESVSENVLELQFTGSNFSTNSNTPFTYTGDVFVDWGDDTGLIEYTGGALSHSYSVSDTYTIKVYGDITSFGSNCFESCSNLISVIIPNSVTSLGASCFINCSGLISVEIPDSVTSFGGYCFSDCSSLTSINIPDSITSLKVNSFFGCSNLISLNIPSNVISLGDNCFYDCTGLISLQLNWIGNDILTYKSNWIRNTSTSLKFIIPFGTTQLYIDKGYPSNKLMEIGNISLSSDKNILSYYDNDTATLSATVTSPNNEPISGATVEFFNDSTSMGTVITNSNGIATMIYESEEAESVVFTAETSTLSSDTITIEDIKKYDSASVDKTSDYSSSNTRASLTHANSNYILTNQQSSNGFGFMSLNNLSVGNRVEIDVDIFIPDTTTSNTQPRLTIMNNDSNVGVGLDIYITTLNPTISLRRIVPNSEGQTIYESLPVSLSTNTWYTVKLIVNNNNFTGEIHEKIWNTTENQFVDNLIRSISSTISNVISDTNNRVGIQHCYTPNALCYWKNLKIISLNPKPSNVSLTSDKSVLSYYDNDSAILSATVLDQYNQPMENETVEFYYQEHILARSISIGTSTTNSNGIATKTYDSTGIGHIFFSARAGMAGSARYDIEDIGFYDGTFDKTSEYIPVSSENSTGVMSLVSDTDKYIEITSNNISSSYIPYELPTNCSIELDVQRNNTNIGLAILKSNGDIWGFVATASNYINRWSYQNQSWAGGESYYYLSDLSYTGWLHFKIVKNDTSILLTITNSNDEVLINQSFTLISWLTNETIYAGIFSGVGRSYVKNLKIKTL